MQALFAAFHCSRSRRSRPSCLAGATAVTAQRRSRGSTSPTSRRRRRSSTGCCSSARSGPANIHIDLGSGDGRIAVTSAAKHGARSLGVDLNPVRIEEARANAKKAGVSDRATFELKNLFETDIGKADIVTMYLLPSVNLELRPKVLQRHVARHPHRLARLRHGRLDARPPRERRSAARSICGSSRRASKAAGRIEGSHKFTVTIQQKYQEITGTAEIGGKTVPLRDASLSGAEIGFAIDIDGMPYRFQGIVNGDRIDGRRNEWRAARAK